MMGRKSRAGGSCGVLNAKCKIEWVEGGGGAMTTKNVRDGKMFDSTLAIR